MLIHMAHDGGLDKMVAIEMMRSGQILDVI